MVCVNNLIVEVTRRCNMRCEHCMRGAAQKLDMSEEVISAMFRGMGYIGDITFTGGEPTLAVPVIEKVIAEARVTGVTIGNFFVVTNGKTDDATAKRFALALLDLYADLNGYEKELTGLVVSGDVYHEYVDVPKVYKGLAFFREERHGPKREADVIRMGRAKFGARKPRKLGPFEVSEDIGDNLSVDTVYVAANGNVVSDCDFSYSCIDKKSRGNLLREPLADIVRRDIIKED